MARISSRLPQLSEGSREGQPTDHGRYAEPYAVSATSPDDMEMVDANPPRGAAFNLRLHG